MFLDVALSEIGRKTGQAIECLRQQLGPGCDPAFDYEEFERQQKINLQRERDKRNQKADPDSASGPASGVEQLRRVLREVAGATAGLGTSEELLEKAHAASPVSPEESKRLREESRNTSAFKAPAREDLQKLDLENRFRAPPLGTYRPKSELLSTSRRIQISDFGARTRNRSRKVVEQLEEIERLKEEKEPYEHLTKWGVSIELKEGIPENNLTKRKLRNCDIGKQLPRPDPVKSAGIVFHENSFTAGVLDGDKIRINRQPEWDFAKTSTAVEKLREYYFQPGQYKCNLDVVRPKLEKKNIPFELRPARKPMKEVLGRFEIDGREGDHLPDRSLARSCPVLSNYPRTLLVPDVEKCTERPPIINPSKAEWHDVSDPVVDRLVLKTQMDYDAVRAIKAVYPRSPTAEDFGLSLRRMQQLRKTRSYGEDKALHILKENLTRGPVSVELLENWEIDKVSCSNRPRVQTKNFSLMPGRAAEKNYIASPARQKEVGSPKMMFSRNIPEGHTRICLSTSFSKGTRS